MTRKKVKLEYITSDSARKATYKKRKAGLMKKVKEISTLCGIRACAIISSPYDPQQEVWPSRTEAQNVVAEFGELPEVEKMRKKVNQEGYLKERILKANGQIKRVLKENREKEMTQLMFQCLSKGPMQLQNLNYLDLFDLKCLIDQKMDEIEQCTEDLIKKTNTQVPPPPAMGAPVMMDMTPPPPPPPPQDLSTEAMQEQPWFMEMMNPPEQMGPLVFDGDHNNNNNNNNNNNPCALWFNAFSP